MRSGSSPLAIALAFLSAAAFGLNVAGLLALLGADVWFAGFAANIHDQVIDSAPQRDHRGAGTGAKNFSERPPNCPETSPMKLGSTPDIIGACNQTTRCTRFFATLRRRRQSCGGFLA